VGDKVKTIDSNGELIDTDVIMIMDKSSQKCKIIFRLKIFRKSLELNLLKQCF
jgi:hypothetical protein